MSVKQRVSVVEDDVEINQRLCNIISAGDEFILVHSARSIADAKVSLLEDKPDLLLVDLGLIDGSGIELIKLVYQEALDTQCLVISGFQDDRTVFAALEAGAVGYLLKYDNSQKITESMHQVFAGGAPMSPIIARMVLERFHNKPKQVELPDMLTERQLLILKYVSQGFSSKEIAEKLSVSYFTVTTHIKNIYGKLQVNSRAEAIQEAHKYGLLGQ